MTSGPDVIADCALDEAKMRSGEDTRTTLMIRNIPNKYTTKMLMSEFDENVPGLVDFFYLPMDCKNTCNVGYAFVNITTQAGVPVIFDQVPTRRPLC